MLLLLEEMDETGQQTNYAALEQSASADSLALTALNDESQEVHE